MIIKHQGHTPRIDPTAYIAPNATICGDVTIDKNSRIMFGATIIAEGGSITIGEHCVILENAVLRSTPRHNLVIENAVLIGPNAHVVGCHIEDNVFVATGAAIFHGATLERNSEVRINGVVHLKTRLPQNETVPIGWVAVGNPAQLFPPDQHDAIWHVQRPLNFPLTVYGVDRKENGDTIMPEIMTSMVEALKTHMQDEIISDRLNTYVLDDQRENQAGT